MTGLTGGIAQAGWHAIRKTLEHVPVLDVGSDVLLRQVVSRAVGLTRHLCRDHLVRHRAEASPGPGRPGRDLLPIDSGFLHVYLLSRFLEQEDLLRTCGAAAPDPADVRTEAERREYLDDLAIHALHGLRCMEAATRPGFAPRTHGVTAEALPCAVARLLDRFGRCWGVDPRIDLRGNLAAAHAVDVLLTFSKQRYGDHGFHAVDVCALGLLLLDAHLFGNETEPGPRLMEVVAERLSDRAGRQVEPAEVIDNWLVASLLHDVGYCLNTVSQAESLLSRLCSPPVDRFRELVAEALRAAEDGFPTDLAAMAADAGVVVPDGHGGGAQRPDHGSVSFANLLEVLLRIDRGDSYLVREPGPSPAGVVERYLPALRAVYCHAVHGHALSFDEEPLAFLLALVDELQEWNRPRRDDVTALAGGFSAWRRFGLAPPRPAPSPMRFVLADLGLAPPRDEEAGRMTPSFRFPEEGPAFHLLFERRDRAEYLPVRTVLSKAGSFQRLSATNLPWPRGIVVACLFPVPSRSDPSPSELDVYGGVRRLKRGLPRPRRAEDYLALLDRGSGRFDAFSYLRMTGNRRRTFSLRWGRGQGDWTALEDRLDGHEVFLFEVLGLGRLARPPAGTPPRPLFPADLGPYLRHVRQVQQQLDAE